LVKIVEPPGVEFPEKSQGFGLQVSQARDVG
jgi:hypothetical protein